MHSVPLATQASERAQAGPAVEVRALQDVTEGGDSPRRSWKSEAKGEALPHQDWERYKIISFLGAGGMGAVYKAVDPRLRRTVAIKFLRAADVGHAGDRQRRNFSREARAQASVDHPHICKIYEVGEVQGEPYIVMQLIEGYSLHALQLVMTRNEKVRIVQKIAEALHAAHQAQVIHRDIKPANILIERRVDGNYWPYLMDFGLAREVDSNTLSSQGGVEGTPAFMAPEQARGEKRHQDVRTDVYGLGATLYCALTGRPPFVGSSPDVLMALLLDDPPPLRSFDPAIPPALEAVVGKCLEKEQWRRYGSALAMAEDLARYLEGVRVVARPRSLLRRLKRFAQRRRLLVASTVAVLLTSIVLGSVALRVRWQASKQAALAQRLGQEMKDMEWLLRSSRQLQLHSLEREKVIIRKRMSRLNQELQGYGELSRGLAHYALGRGHMALHEYPQALAELQQAIAKGYQEAEVHYALGLVLGKHYEQAMDDARLSGGGDWAKKQLREIEPKYLTPAIESLKQSRKLKLDAPEYLEGLIAYYQRDFKAALRHAESALVEAPWLYEAWKLSGDVHLEKAQLARHSGLEQEARGEFASAVKCYESAAVDGRSDAEVYEGLAEAWVQQTELATHLGLSVEAPYAAAVAAAGKLSVAEPLSITGPLKIERAAMITMSLISMGSDSSDRIKQCLAAGARVLSSHPRHPYASQAASTCYLGAAEQARKRGEDPEPLIRKALQVLTPAVEQNPRFLWGQNELGLDNLILGMHLQLHGRPDARATLEKSLHYFAETAALDPSYLVAPNNSLATLVMLIPEAESETALLGALVRADAFFAACVVIDSKDQQCYNNYFQSYARAAQRALQAGQDPQPHLHRALENLARTRKLGGKMPDCEQHAALAHLVQARDLLRLRQSPAPALALMDADLASCFAINAQDAVCRTLAVQQEWVQADWLASQKLSAVTKLEAALVKARWATESQEVSPEAWQALAEAHLRLAPAAVTATQRAQQVQDGVAAAQKLFAINPTHALGLTTYASLLLLRADAEVDRQLRQQTIQSAARALVQALQRDPFLQRAIAPLQERTRTLLEGSLP